MRAIIGRWPVLQALIFGMLLCPKMLHAAEPSPHVLACIEQAARHQGVDPWLLAAIARTESDFSPAVTGLNTNGTQDLGLFQINDRWLPALSRFGLVRENLYDPCVSAQVGAWILAKNIRTYGYSWQAIAAYNTRDPQKGLIYARRVYAAHAALLRRAPYSP